MDQNQIVVELPAWVDVELDRFTDSLDTVERRMALVLTLARKTIEHKTGGPFGAGIFEAQTGRLVSAGVNLVTSSNCSLAHAEMVAIGLAQQRLGTYDLSQGETGYELVTSTEPCAMCLGAIPWSGVRRVVCGARGQDACAIGFDEGAKPSDWIQSLQRRGIEVVCDVLGDNARAVLQQYLTEGGPIYNPENR